MNSLLLAVRANDVGEIQRLLTFSPICRKLVNYQAPQNHETPLFVASVRGYTGVVHWLLNRGARVDVTTSWGATALHAAAERGHDSIIKLLLEQKAPLQMQTQYGDTALHLAAFRGHHRVILLLLAAGIDTTIANSKGRTAVDEAEIAGHHIITKRLRYESLSRSDEDSNVDEKRPKDFGSTKTALLKHEVPHHPNGAWGATNVPCNPPRNVSYDVDKHLGHTVPATTSDKQDRVKDWVMNYTALPNMASSTTEGPQTKVRFCDDEVTEGVFVRPAPLRPANVGSTVKPTNCARRKAAMLKYIGKSQSCEGIGMETKVDYQTTLPEVDDVGVRPHARCRRVNSLERAVEELQNEVRMTRDEMERAKADIIDVQNMMRLCWARGGGALISERVTNASEEAVIGQRFIMSPMSSDVTNPFDVRRHSNPQFQSEHMRKELPQTETERMSE